MLIPILSLLLSAAFPAVFLYCKNAEEAAFPEIVPALLVFSVVGLILLLACGAIFHSMSKGAVAAILLTLVIINFALIENVLKLAFPDLKYWHTLPIIFVIVFHLIFLIWKFMPQDISAEIANVICLVFSGLMIFNIVLSVPQILNRVEAGKELQELQEENQIKNNYKSDSFPNIYNIIQPVSQPGYN